MFSSPPRMRGSRFPYDGQAISGIPAFAGMTAMGTGRCRGAFDRLRLSGDGYGVPCLTGWRWAPAFTGGRAKRRRDREEWQRKPARRPPRSS